MGRINIKYDSRRFIEALEPGLSVIVMSAFEKKLADKMNGIVEEVYEEMRNELPKLIESKIKHVLSEYDESLKVHVEVDLTGA